MFGSGAVLAILSALLFSSIASVLVHGHLKIRLEMAGVRPWRLRDSVLSAPLMLVGSACLGLSLGFLLVNLMGEIQMLHLAWQIPMIPASILACALGWQALKKLYL